MNRKSVGRIIDAERAKGVLVIQGERLLLFYSYSIMTMGTVVLVLNLMIAAPNACFTAWDPDIVKNSVCILIASVLIGSVVRWQINVGKTITSTAQDVRTEVPPAWRWISIPFYAVSVLCLFIFAWSLSVPEVCLVRMPDGDLVALDFMHSMANRIVGVADFISEEYWTRVRGVVNARAWFSLIVLFSSWCCYGVAKTCSLIGHNFAMTIASKRCYPR